MMRLTMHTKAQIRRAAKNRVPFHIIMGILSKEYINEAIKLSEGDRNKAALFMGLTAEELAEKEESST